MIKINKQDVIKYLGFTAYLILILAVSCCSAYMRMKFKQELQKKQAPVILKKNEDNSLTPKKAKEEEIHNSIAIVIDDCGIEKDNTLYISNNFPKEISLSFLPYANDLQEQVDIAAANQHEIMLHLPMEAISYNEKGIQTLRETWDDDKLLKETINHLDSFEGYRSVNNHTGSKLTQNHDKMLVVLNELKRRNLPFLDSVTISSSIAYETAQEIGLPTAERNVFIDHKNDIEYIIKQLEKAEKIAKNNGLAIIIGHPRDNTVVALEAWLKTIAERNINLIPVSKVYN
ncbi:MAG: divergent polysaccharide deacetylase family protein [Alphaproteobacteria bacterium]|jgi:polysaccharide deacetylase 2 family uncharacterized protein YibQ|nr:divergent polysaccharide deacetylase family protein [Alphaproteobacteria bacterium]MCV6599862.1 divergent polysaccharide deacetylase family protein [Alphaproteobacteria bacterium]